ncbi:hypothetical protein ES703_106281 [subsurface metagenome]
MNPMPVFYIGFTIGYWLAVLYTELLSKKRKD